MRTLSALAKSMMHRLTFCSQQEHKRETIETSMGCLAKRCIDCGHVTPLGTIRMYASNRKVSA